MSNKNKKFYISPYGDSLQDLIDEIKVSGLTEDDFKKLKFSKDYSECWNDSEEPNIVLEYES